MTKETNIIGLDGHKMKTEDKNDRMKQEINPETLENFKCSGCGGDIFSTQYNLKIIPESQTGASEGTIMPHPVFICLKCFKPLQIV